MIEKELKYAIVILLERKYSYDEIKKLFNLPEWKVYQYGKHYKLANELINKIKEEQAKVVSG